MFKCSALVDAELSNTLHRLSVLTVKISAIIECSVLISVFPGFRFVCRAAADVSVQEVPRWRAAEEHGAHFEERGFLQKRKGR